MNDLILTVQELVNKYETPANPRSESNPIMLKTEQKNLTRQNIMDAIRYGGELFDSIAAYTYHYITSMNDAETGHSIESEPQAVLPETR